MLTLSWSYNLHNYMNIYVYIKTTEKLNSIQITLVEKYDYIKLVEGQVTKEIGFGTIQ